MDYPCPKFHGECIGNTISSFLCEDPPPRCFRRIDCSQDGGHHSNRQSASQCRDIRFRVVRQWKLVPMNPCYLYKTRSRSAMYRAQVHPVSESCETSKDVCRFARRTHERSLLRWSCWWELRQVCARLL